MKEQDEKGFNTIKVNGLELKSLRGGFIAFIPSRSEDDKGEEREKEPENRPSEERRFLLCKACGTIIQVHPPGRIARCCDQTMVPLVEMSPPEAAKEEDAAPEVMEETNP